MQTFGNSHNSEHLEHSDNSRLSDLSLSLIHGQWGSENGYTWHTMTIHKLGSSYTWLTQG